MKFSIIMALVCLFTVQFADARLRNPWIVADGHINCWSCKKMTTTHNHWPAFAAYDSANPDAFFKDVVGNMMVWEHRAEGNGVPSAFQDFEGNISYCRKNGYTYHYGSNYYQEWGTQEMDWIKYIGTLGYGYCGIQNHALWSLFTQLGYEARCVNLEGGGHFICDVFFNGGWHYYDLDEGGWANNASGVSYGLDYAVDNPSMFDLASDRTSLGTHNYFWSYGTDLSYIRGAIQNPYYMYFGNAQMGADMGFSLRIGEKYERFWDAINSSYSVGTPLSQTPAVFGNGRITYAPNLGSAYADFLDGVYEMSNVQQVSNGVQATGASAYVTWAIRSSHPIYNSTVTLGGSGVSFQYSSDMGVTWNTFSSPTAVQGLYDYLLKVNITNGSILTSLNVVTITMLRPGVLPRLRQGSNACQFQMYDNDETLTMRPLWNNSTNYNTYMVYNNGFAWSNAETADDYAMFPNGGVTATGNRNQYATLKLPGPATGQVVGASGFCVFGRNFGMTFWNNLSGWTEDASAQIRLSSQQTSGYARAAYNTLHKNTTYAMCERMEDPNEWGFGVNWASVGMNRKPIANPGRDGYFQFFYNGNDGSTNIRGMVAYAHYYVNLLPEDYLNDITITHRWNRASGGQGETTQNISAEEIADALENNNGVFDYTVNIPDALLGQNPNHSIVMEVPGSVLMTDLTSNPTTKVAQKSVEDTADPAYALTVSPVPANPTVTIAYAVPRKGAKDISIKIYDASGKVMYEFAKLTMSRGSVVWNGVNGNGALVSSGVYVVRLMAGEKVLSKKINLIR